jgi:hypothetical protein
MQCVHKDWNKIFIFEYKYSKNSRNSLIFIVSFPTCFIWVVHDVIVVLVKAFKARFRLTAVHLTQALTCRSRRQTILLAYRIRYASAKVKVKKSVMAEQDTKLLLAATGLLIRCDQQLLR